MKKFVKMSLVAALAVAGTTASAQPLAEAIKNVDVSGTVVYRYDDKSTESEKAGVPATSASNNNYKVGLSLSSKVNDDVKFNSRFVVGSSNSGFAGLDTQANADANVNVALSTANFAYSGIANTTVIVGKQGLGTPWTNAIDSDGNEETGTGILAVSTMGPVTAAAGYFNQTNLGTSTTLSELEANTIQYIDNDKSKSFTAGDDITSTGKTADISAADLAVVGLMGKVAMVNAEAWYLDLQDLADSYFVKASASFDVDAVKIGLAAQYSDLEFDGTQTDNDHSLAKYSLTAKMGIFNAGITYAETGKDGSGILNAVSKNSAIGYTVSLHGADNADLMQYDLGAQVTPELHIGLNYDVVSDDDAAVDGSDDIEETYVQITYNMSKNLSTYVRLADGEDGKGASAVDYNRGRVQVEYKF